MSGLAGLATKEGPKVASGNAGPVADPAQGAKDQGGKGSGDKRGVDGKASRFGGLFTLLNPFSSFPSSSVSTSDGDSNSKAGKGSQKAKKGAQKTFGYHDFVEKMKQPQAQDLVRFLKSYVDRIDNSQSFDGARKEHTKKVHEFINNVYANIQKHPLWKDACPEELDNVLESLEKTIMSKFYSRIFGASREARALDSQLSHKIKTLAFLKPEHLDIPSRYHDQKAFDLAMTELRNMDNFKSPRDKIISLLNCSLLRRVKVQEQAEKDKAKAKTKEVKEAKGGAEESASSGASAGGAAGEGTAGRGSSKSPEGGMGAEWEGDRSNAEQQQEQEAASESQLREAMPAVGLSPSADDFLPLLIYIVIKAQAPKLHLSLEYISCARNPSKLTGEADYFCMSLRSAVSFVLSIDHSKLTISEEEYRARVVECAEKAAGVEGERMGVGAAGELSNALHQVQLANLEFPEPLFVDYELSELKVGQLSQLLKDYKAMARGITRLAELSPNIFRTKKRSVYFGDEVDVDGPTAAPDHHGDKDDGGGAVEGESRDATTKAAQQLNEKLV